MTTSEQIKVLCVRMGISVSELARRIGQSPQNFNAKLKRGTITEKDLIKIADILVISYEQTFTLPNGEKIIIKNTGEVKKHKNGVEWGDFWWKLITVDIQEVNIN